MAKNNAVILIKGEQVIDGEHDVTEIDVTGDLSETDGGLKLEFWEYLDEKEKVHTEIGIDGHTVSMKKDGSVATEMIFEKGVRHNGEYVTPVGALSVGVNTNDVVIDIEDGSGKILLEYDLDFNMGFLAKNKLEIKLNPKE